MTLYAPQCSPRRPAELPVTSWLSDLQLALTDEVCLLGLTWDSWPLHWPVSCWDYCLTASPAPRHCPSRGPHLWALHMFWRPDNSNPSGIQCHPEDSSWKPYLGLFYILTNKILVTASYAHSMCKVVGVVLQVAHCTTLAVTYMLWMTSDKWQPVTSAKS